MSETYAVELKTDSVKDLQFHSWIEDTSGNVVEAHDVGRSILAVPPTDRSLHPDIVIARAGEVVRMPRPHQRILPAGVYAEVLRLAISADGYSDAIMVTQIRYIRVFADGRLTGISSADFTTVADGQPEPIRKSQGRWTTAYRGKSFPVGSAKAQKVFAPRFDAQGRMINADMRTSAEPAPANGDQSEMNER